MFVMINKLLVRKQSVLVYNGFLSSKYTDTALGYLGKLDFMG